jgi:hypothetical protein
LYAGRPLPERRAHPLHFRFGKVSTIQAAISDDWRQPLKFPYEARAFVESASIEHYELAFEFRREPSGVLA